MLEQTQNFLMCGFSIFEEDKILDLSKFNITNVEDNDKLENNFTEHEQSIINDFIEYVNDKYVKPLYKNYSVLYYSVWDGVDLGSTNWHNDSAEGFDFNMLYYFDNTDEETGGQVEFKYPGGKKIIYPKHGNLIFINQDKKFLHKVSRSKNKRRVFSVEYKII